MDDSIRIDVTSTEHDDFINHRMSVTASHPDGTAVRWSLPDRLLRRDELWPVVQEELIAELDEKRARIPR